MPHSLLVLAFSALLLMSPRGARGDCTACPKAGMCDQICNSCIVTGTGPAWLQGTWGGYKTEQDASVTASPSNYAELRVNRSKASLTAAWSGSTTLSSNPFFRKSPEGVARASEFDMDDDYYAPAWFSNYVTYTVVRHQVEGKFGQIETLVASNNGECAELRTPADRFTPPISVFYRLVKYNCITPILTVTCPTWLQGVWRGVARDGNTGSVQAGAPIWTLELRGGAFLFNTTIDGAPSFLTGAATCNAAASAESLRAPSHLDLVAGGGGVAGTTFRTMVQLLLGNGTIEVMRPPPDWCSRPASLLVPPPPNPFSTPLPFEHAKLVCVTPRLAHACSRFVQGRWLGHLVDASGNVAAAPSRNLTVLGSSVVAYVKKRKERKNEDESESRERRDDEMKRRNA